MSSEPYRYSPATRRAIRRYGEATCRRAFALSERGEGAASIGLLHLSLTTRQADAAINAGRDMQATDGANVLDAIVKGEF